MPTTCEMTFEKNALKVFTPGQWMLGNVRLIVEEEWKMHGVYVQIWGRAYAKKKKANFLFNACEDYINKKVYLVGGEGREVRLTPFEYIYKFQCRLPDDIPTSCEGKIGYIRYTASVIFDLPNRLNSQHEEAFTVIKSVDLNSDPAIREPTIVREKHTFWPYALLCCFPSNPIEIIARTPVGGYTPGQTINLDIKVHNKSNQRISQFFVKLFRKINYSNTMLDGCLPIFKKCAEQITVKEQKVQGCDAYHSNYIRVNLVVPPLPPTDDSSSNILKISYFIQIIGSVSFCHSNPRVKVPIIIGTYPIEDNIDEQSQCNTDNSSQSETNSETSRKYDHPNYEEAIPLGKKSNKKSFRPLYPVYKNETSYSTHI